MQHELNQDQSGNMGRAAKTPEEEIKNVKDDLAASKGTETVNRDTVRGQQQEVSHSSFLLLVFSSGR